MTRKLPPAERRSEILEAALRIFVSKGYADTRMDDIVVATGLSKGALYHHFSSKRELFLSLIEHWLDQFAPVMDQELHSGKSSAEIFRVFTRVNIMLFRPNNDWFLA